MKAPRHPRHLARITSLIAGLLIATSSMAAAPDNRFSPETQANELIELWRNTCVKYFRDPAALRDAARKAGYLENPPNGDSMLNGQPGTVWDASSSVYSQRVLVSLDIGGCEVRGQIASSDVVQREFTKSMEALASADVTVKHISDEQKTEASVDEHQQKYAVADNAIQKAWLFGAGTSESPLVKTQAVLTAIPSNSHAKTSVNPATIMDKLLAEREALFDARGIDVPQLSQDIGAAVRDSMQLEHLGKSQQALDRLRPLEKYAPLTDIPSAMVPLIASFLNTKLGNVDLGKQYKDVGGAYTVLLRQRIGKGDSTDDPIRVVLVNEAAEWVQIQGGQVVSTRSTVAHGHELMVLTYQGTFTNNQPRDLYVEIDPRTQAQMNKTLDRYAAVPQSALRPQDKEHITRAQDKRERFLNDTNFPFMELQGSIRPLIKAAAALDQAGKPQDALSKLREIERLRPLEDIPTPTLLSMYSYLTGKTGDTQKQAELRGLIFGVQQVIANSGDGKSPATAIHVILVDEEYDWLDAKKLKMQKQRLQKDGDATYDVLDVQDAQGATSQVYFDITRLFGKYNQGMSGPATH